MIAGFPELLVSLTIQCTLLLLVTRFFSKQTWFGAAPDRLWLWCHLLILMLAVVGILLPHARLFRNVSLLNICHQVTALPVLQRFWAGVFWIWFSVAVALAANFLRSLVQTSLMLRSAAEWTPPLVVDGDKPAEDRLSVRCR